MSKKTVTSIMVLEKGKPFKSFRAEVWDNGDRAKVYVELDDEDEEFEYKMKGYALRCCMNAVVKYWPDFDPAINTITIIK